MATCSCGVHDARSYPVKRTEPTLIHPNLPECVVLDFSHLRAEGVGSLLTPPLRERGNLKAPAPHCSDLGDEGHSAPKWATLRLLAQSARGMPFGHCVQSPAPAPRAHEEQVDALCESLSLFAGRWARATRKTSQRHSWIGWLMRIAMQPNG